jgi:3-methyladenine DNA glycosylase AlkD
MTENLRAEILLQLKKHSGRGTKHSGNMAYLGNVHFSYHISTPVKRGIAKAFVRERQEISPQNFLRLLDALFRGRSHDEKVLAAILLGYSEIHRQHVTPEYLDSWLDHLGGWAEVDALCYSNIAADQMLAHWREWKAMLATFSKDKNVHKRRASLVLLTGPVYHSPDPRLSKIAFENIGRLKSEKDILITKAISWLLRRLIRNHKKEVAAYIETNADGLPKIAVRETRRKLLTGRK